MSYAQRGEDETLWKALRGIDKGFYIDVGAESPNEGTVTRLFYEIGWSGINIEPVRSWYDQLRMCRPRDTTLNVAASNKLGSLELFEVIGTGLSTIRQDYAEKAQRDYNWGHRRITVPCIRLDSLGFPPDIHFLKIDVEGAERQVLEGFDFVKHRPWIILIEATEPNSDVPSHGEWEDLVLAAGYEFALFDTLNRYYVPRERQDLKEALNAPV